MRPPLAIARRMRIALLVGMLVVDAMRGHPENRAALKRQRRANREEVFDPEGSFVASVREQAMVADANTEARRNPPEQCSDRECFPGEKEQRHYGANVEGHHERGCNPID